MARRKVTAGESDEFIEEQNREKVVCAKRDVSCILPHRAENRHSSKLKKFVDPRKSMIPFFPRTASGPRRDINSLLRLLEYFLFVFLSPTSLVGTAYPKNESNGRVTDRSNGAERGRFLPHSGTSPDSGDRPDGTRRSDTLHCSGNPSILNAYSTSSVFLWFSFAEIPANLVRTRLLNT